MNEWNAYWSLRRRGHFHTLAFFYRKNILAPIVSSYCDRYFSEKGHFAELGCGSGESSFLIPKKKRTFVAVDISKPALDLAASHAFFSEFIQLDIRDMDPKKFQFDGIWNIGVMEHFKKNELIGVLTKINSILKDDGTCVFFWPTAFGPVTILSDIFDFINRLTGSKRTLFPKAFSLYQNREQIKKILQESGFKLVDIHFSFRDLRQNAIVVARK